MPIVRLAYVALFLIAVVAVFTLWSQVGGQSHLDLVPWYLKLALGCGAASTTVMAAAATLESKQAWNLRTLRWLALTLVLLAGCGAASYYAHLFGETDEDDEDDQENATVGQIFVPPTPGIPTDCPRIN
jgi:hypothetical protein